MTRHKRISGLHAARIAAEHAQRDSVKLASSAQGDGKGLVAFSPQVDRGARKAPPRLKKPSKNNDAIVAPTVGLEEHKAALRQVFGETLSDEFVDVMLAKLISPCVQDRMTCLRKQL
jgi:hypothetical protein